MELVQRYLRISGAVTDAESVDSESSSLQGKSMNARFRPVSAPPGQELSAFLDDLGKDGIFVLQLLAHNAGEDVSAKLVRQLWENKFPHHVKPL